ncbi:hypothetical protein [Stenotrophomonas forensis]|uniref:hypothetical protein n=1 Tax=Stenotrophomonas forensis TaxID=2871169 RepID=UPI0039C5F684
MTSQVQICNLALGKLAQDITITSLTERSKEARAFSRLWEPMRDLVLADRLWPWAIMAQRLAVAAESPMPGWQIRYARPSDCITAIAVTDDAGLRAGRRMSLWCEPNYCQRHGVPFEQVYGEQDTSLMCDLPEAWLVYVCRVTNTDRYPPHFVEALACKLAEESAPVVIGGNGLSNKPGLKQLYQLALSQAAAHDFNESDEPGHEMSAAQMARG